MWVCIVPASISGAGDLPIPASADCGIPKGSCPKIVFRKQWNGLLFAIASTTLD